MTKVFVCCGSCGSQGEAEEVLENMFKCAECGEYNDLEPSWVNDEDEQRRYEELAKEYVPYVPAHKAN